MESILRYSTETQLPTPRKERTRYCEYWSRKAEQRIDQHHTHKDRCTNPVYVQCPTCGYETEQGIPCGLPCV